MKVLLLEDDTVLADILIDFLQEDYNVSHTFSMKEALKLAEETHFDFYIFDINVPDGDGITLLKELRTFSDTTPAIFITAFHDTKYLKSAFEAGANDFIRKPFDLEELNQRIENLKRHFGLQSVVELADGIGFDTQTRRVTIGKNSFILRAKESQCLHFLYKNKNRVVSVDEILQNIWDYDEMPSEDAIRTIIKELRKVIGKDHILNIRGQGYRFE